MNIPVPSEQLIIDIELSEKDYMKDRMKAIQLRQGNPEQVEIAYFGNAMCLYSKTMPWPTFNTVKGITSEDIDHLDQIVDFYRTRERKVQFEIIPSRVDQQILLELSNLGLYQSEFHTSMYCSPTDISLEEQGHVHIKELNENDFITYATIHCRGTGLPDNGIPYVTENNRILWNRPGWKFFMAYVSDRPAAVGVMFMKGGIASLTFAATLPDFRKQGLHQCLLNRRIIEAKQHDCKLVVSQCAFLSPSHRNMDRIGMKLGYIRTTWTER